MPGGDVVRAPSGRAKGRTAPTAADSRARASSCRGESRRCRCAPRYSVPSADGSPRNAGSRLRPSSGMIGAPVVPRRIGRARRLEDGRQHVGQLERRRATTSPRRVARRPVDDQRRRDAALVHPPLVVAKRRVRQVGPRATVARVRVLAPGHDRRLVADPHLRAVARLRRRMSERALNRSSLTSGSASSEAPLSDRKITSVLSSLPAFFERGEDAADALDPAGRSARRRLPSGAPAILVFASFHAGCVGSRSLSVAASSRIPSSRKRRSRRSRSTSQPVERAVGSCATSASRACSGQCGAVNAT